MRLTCLFVVDSLFKYIGSQVPVKSSIVCAFLCMSVAAKNYSSVIFLRPGAVPVELSNLTRLESLSLYTNHFTGQVPQEVSWVKNQQGHRFQCAVDSRFVGAETLNKTN